MATRQWSLACRTVQMWSLALLSLGSHVEQYRCIWSITIHWRVLRAFWIHTCSESNSKWHCCDLWLRHYMIQELSYRKQLTQDLRTNYVKGIYNNNIVGSAVNYFNCQSL